MKVPPLDLVRQYHAIKDELDAAVGEVMASGRYVLGEHVERLEGEIAQDVGVAHAVACASGSDALLLSLVALGVGPGDEVVTTPFTFFATASCIARLGARPVFADIDPQTFNLDPAAVEDAITDRTRAIIVVHLYGQCADMTALAHVADARGVPIIEDACQAIGASHRGRFAGSMGATGCFSFYPTKNLSAAGDAGMITTDDDALADQLRRLRVHGSGRRYHHDSLGINSRMDALQGAILRVKLRHLPAWNEARRAIAQRYDEAFASLDVTTPVVADGNTHVYHQYVIRAENRDALAGDVREDGIAVETYYPIPLHLQTCFADLGYAEGAFPRSERASKETMALPVFAEMTDEEITAVTDSLARAMAGAAGKAHTVS